MTKSVDLALINEQERLAQERNAMIVMQKSKNKVGFTQVIQDNLEYLVTQQVLKSHHNDLILRLLPYIEIGSNFLSFKDRTPFNISTLSKRLKTSRPNLSKNINELIELGMIFEFVDVWNYRLHGRIVEERPLFFNPEVIVTGDKNKIELTLTRLLLLNDRFERNGVYLPKKIHINPKGNGGKLYDRSTYLRKRKEYKKTPT